MTAKSAGNANRDPVQRQPVVRRAENVIDVDFGSNVHGRRQRIDAENHRQHRENLIDRAILTLVVAGLLGLLLIIIRTIA